MREPCRHLEHHPWGGYFCALGGYSLGAPIVPCCFVNEEENCEDYEPSGFDRGSEDEYLELED